MFKKICFIIMALLFCVYHLQAVQSHTFLIDGNVVADQIIDMSSNTGEFEYEENEFKIERSRIWMINFVDANWNFPDERERLSDEKDTIFLTNGQVLYKTIADFSSRRMIFEFEEGGNVAETQVKRIYFCCTGLPDAFAEQLDTEDDDYNSGDEGEEGGSFTFMVDERVIDSPLAMLNKLKTNFASGLQVNTKDIMLINYEENAWDYPEEREALDEELDTIILNSGKIIYDEILEYDGDSGKFTLKNKGELSASQVKRVYFCCFDYGDQN